MSYKLEKEIFFIEVISISSGCKWLCFDRKRKKKLKSLDFTDYVRSN